MRSFKADFSESFSSVEHWRFLYDITNVICLGMKDFYFNLKVKEWLKTLCHTVLDCDWLQEINKWQIAQLTYNMFDFHIPGSVSQTLKKIRGQMVKAKNKQ